MSKQIKSITQNSSMMFIGKIFDSFIMFAFNVLAAKFIGAENYGVYVYLSALIMFVSIAIKFGMDQGLTAMVPKQSDDQVKKSLISFSFYMIIVVSGFFILLAIVGSKFIAKYMMNSADLSKYIVYIAPLFLLYALIHLSEGIFRTIGEVKTFVFGKNILMPAGITGTLVLMYFVFDAKSVAVLILSNYVGGVLSVGYLTLFLIKKHYLIKIDTTYKLLYKQLLVISSGLILVGLLDFLVGRIDAYIVGYMMDESYVGIYNVFDKIAYLSTYFFVAFGSIMAPYISGIYHQNRFQELKLVYHFVTKMILVINGFILGGLLLNIQWILAFFGDAYESNQVVIMVLLGAYFVNALGGPVVYMNTMTGNGKQEIHIGMASLIGNGILDILLIGKYGIFGVAFATVSVFSIALIIRLSILYKTQGITPFTKGYFYSILIIVTSIVIAFFVKSQINIDNQWISRIIITTIFGIVWLMPVVFTVFTKTEKAYIIKLLPNKK